MWTVEGDLIVAGLEGETGPGSGTLTVSDDAKVFVGGELRVADYVSVHK